MPSNAIIDISIGLILMFLVLSLICTITNEFVANIVSLRARTLRDGITRLVDDDRLRTAFLDHGLIASANESSASRLGPSYLSGRTVALALLDSLNTGTAVPAIQDIVTAIGQLPESNVKDALQTAATAAQGDINKLRAGVASWFDDSMDRLSGIYKRRMHWISFGIGLAITIILNADTVSVSKSLWLDSALRAQAVQLASTVAAKQSNPAQATIMELQQDLRPMPIGWDSAPGRPDYNWYRSISGTVEKIIGWLITALAITLGAPFWFDLLGKFVNLRTSGDKPEQPATP